jgi:hypothetical protein
MIASPPGPRRGFGIRFGDDGASAVRGASARSALAAAYSGLTVAATVPRGLRHHGENEQASGALVAAVARLMLVCKVFRRETTAAFVPRTDLGPRYNDGQGWGRFPTLCSAAVTSVGTEGRRLSSASHKTANARV